MSRPTFARAPALVAVQSVGRGAVWILGLGAFGLAFSITVTAAYLPPLLGEFTGSKTLMRSSSGRRACSRSRSLS